MAAFQCPRCGQQRAKARDSLCPVCWLLEDFVIEHRVGLHAHKAVHGCGECNGRLRAELARIAPPIVAVSDDASTRRETLRVALSARTTTSHSSCTHDNTKAARAKCRAQRKKAS